MGEAVAQLTDVDAVVLEHCRLVQLQANNRRLSALMHTTAFALDMQISLLAHLWKLALDIDIQEARLAARSVSDDDNLTSQSKISDQ